MILDDSLIYLLSMHSYYGTCCGPHCFYIPKQVIKDLICRLFGKSGFMFKSILAQGLCTQDQQHRRSLAKGAVNRDGNDYEFDRSGVLEALGTVSVCDVPAFLLDSHRDRQDHVIN